jgi:hypothetical protein
MGEPSAAARNRAFDSAMESFQRAVEHLSLPGHGSADAMTAVSGVLEEERRDPRPSNAELSESDPLNQLLVDRLGRLEIVARRLASTSANLDRSSPKIPSTPASPSRPASGLRLTKAIIAAVQVLLSAWFIVTINWPAGLQAAMLLVMIVAFLNAQLPVALPIPALAKGVLAALPLSALFYFVVMPRTDGFAELAPWLVVMFFPFLYTVSSTNPLTSMAAMLALLLANSLISISATPPSYNFAAFATVYLGLAGGFLVPLLLTYVLETRSPRRSVHKLVSGILSRSADYLEAMDDPSRDDASRATLAATYRDQTLRSLGQLEQLSALACDRQALNNSPQQIRSVVNAVHTLVVRTIWAGWNTIPSDPERVKQARIRCSASLNQTAQSMRQFRLPKSWTHDHRAVNGGQRPIDREPSTIPDYRSLADAVLDCQRQLAGVDWKRWCDNRF